MAADGASSISVTVRVRPFTIREAAQLTKTDDQTLFLGDGSLAAAPTPKFSSKGIRPVIKVIDEKCLYGIVNPLLWEEANAPPESSTHQRTIPSSASHDR
jgi:hypothetical protein